MGNEIYLRDNAGLADIAPTLLQLLNLRYITIRRKIQLICNPILDHTCCINNNSLISLVLMSIVYLIVTYLIGLLFRFLCCFLNRISIKVVFNDYNTFYHILFTISCGLILEILMGMCSCCCIDEEEIYD